jgi:membrane fusion protein, multidrug efflux system|tara:strand:- start:2877 stop:3986 length:1110 start_codon:yes stop_codon:yes gene_type:complete
MTIHLNKGHIIALSLILLITLWLSIGLSEGDEEYINNRPLVMDDGLQKVQVEIMRGQLVERAISISGKTAANRSVELKSEIRSTVKAIHKKKGERVKKGELIVELNARDWPARVEQSKASLRQYEIEYASSQKLLKRGLVNEAQIAQARTALANAKANLTSAQINLAASRITAPFDGIVDQRYVELGDYVKESTDIVKILDFSPYLVIGHAAEKDASFINIGDPAQAQLITGDIIQGHIRFIAAEANESTRTFPVEMVVDNPSGSMTSGLTAKILVPQPKLFSHLVSPALLILNDQGELGLKGLTENNQVIFHAIKIIKAVKDGIWITGLEEESKIITVGQGFVEYDEKVFPVYKTGVKKINNAEQLDG